MRYLWATTGLAGQDNRRLIWKPNSFSIQVNPVHIPKTYTVYVIYFISISIFSSIPQLGLTSILFSTKRLLALWAQKEYIMKLYDRSVIKQKKLSKI
jgi:hypothetical protein